MLLGLVRMFVHVKECVQLEPKWPKGYSRLGAALWADRQLPEAIKAYEQGLQLDEANEAMQKSKADVEAGLLEKSSSHQVSDFCSCSYFDSYFILCRILSCCSPSTFSVALLDHVSFQVG